MPRRWLLIALGAACMLAGAAGCTQSVTGRAAPAPSLTAAPSASPGPAFPRPGLVSDVLADECLLTAAEFGALVGGTVRPPEQSTVARRDGTTGSSCVATAGAEPVAMINVYRVSSGVPADVVRTPGGRRELPGVGEAAAVVDTQAGPTLQLAGATYLVTILVAGATPDDGAWRTAASAALGRLPA